MCGISNSVEFGEPALRLLIDSESRVKRFLDHGADPSVTGEQASPLATAALEPLCGVFDTLISHGADLDLYALFKAMTPRGRGGIPDINDLTDRGIDINVVRPEYGTPLHYAITSGTEAKEKLELLLQRGGDRIVKNTYVLTPAELAQKKGHLDVFDFLLGDVWS
ncbi:hypothetical protein IFR05_000981 [Cadophora sp. M221]|nr:hypothetical protein IFR05_000981 [Cadophora sp. M221]